MRHSTPFPLKWRVLKNQSVPTEPTDTEATKRKGAVFPYLAVTLAIALLTMLFRIIGYAFTPVNIALLYLLPAFIAAVRWGLWPSIYAAGVGVIAFDFFFIPPIYHFTVGDIRYLITFAVYLAVAVFTASLASQLRQRVDESRMREKVTSALFALSTQVAAARDLDAILQEIVRQAYVTFGLSTVIVLPDKNGVLVPRARFGDDEPKGLAIIESRILRWVYEHGQSAGYGTHRNAEAPLMYVPLKTEANTRGVMCVISARTPPGDAYNRKRVVQALASLAAVSIARIKLEEEAKIAHLTAESERLRTALLDSLSHELRTPLTTVIGAVTGMIESASVLSVVDQRELLLTVREGAMRMNRLVTNLLGMVRLESGMLRLTKKWCDVSDMIGVAIQQTQDALQNRTINVALPPSLPAVEVDDALIEQALVNVLSNAIKYSPDHSTILINVVHDDGVLTITIKDEGIGIAPAEVTKIFDKFYRSKAAKGIPGTGLGLAICKGVIHLHGGEISAAPAHDKGTVITIRLPVEDSEDVLIDTEEEN